MSLFSSETLGTILATLLTIMVLSYLISDNVLFRIATYLFVGVASGYAGAIAYFYVIRPYLIDPLFESGISGLLEPAAIGTIIIPWILTILLLFKASPRLSRFGSLPMALMVGVGAGVIVGGGIMGTLIPQTRAATATLTSEILIPKAGEDAGIWIEGIVSGFILILATISSLLYFRFGAKQGVTGVTSRTKFNAAMAVVGKVFIALTFGVMYAGALAASIIVLAERFQFLGDTLTSLFGGL